jgi:hypothetical protein
MVFGIEAGHDRIMCRKRFGWKNDFHRFRFHAVLGNPVQVRCFIALHVFGHKPVDGNEQNRVKRIGLLPFICRALSQYQAEQ